jgi:hypothetical protein
MLLFVMIYSMNDWYSLTPSSSSSSPANTARPLRQFTDDYSSASLGGPSVNSSSSSSTSPHHHTRRVAITGGTVAIAAAMAATAVGNTSRRPRAVSDVGDLRSNNTPTGAVGFGDSMSSIAARARGISMGTAEDDAVLWAAGAAERMSMLMTVGRRRPPQSPQAGTTGVHHLSPLISPPMPPSHNNSDSFSFPSSTSTSPSVPSVFPPPFSLDDPPSLLESSSPPSFSPPPLPPSPIILAAPPVHINAPLVGHSTLLNRGSEGGPTSPSSSSSTLGTGSSPPTSLRHVRIPIPSRRTSRLHTGDSSGSPLSSTPPSPLVSPTPPRHPPPSLSSSGSFNNEPSSPARGTATLAPLKRAPPASTPTHSPPAVSPVSSSSIPWHSVSTRMMKSTRSSDRYAVRREDSPSSAAALTTSSGSNSNGSSNGGNDDSTNSIGPAPPPLRTERSRDQQAFDTLTHLTSLHISDTPTAASLSKYCRGVPQIYDC